MEVRYPPLKRGVSQRHWRDTLKTRQNACDISKKGIASDIWGGGGVSRTGPREGVDERWTQAMRGCSSPESEAWMSP